MANTVSRVLSDETLNRIIQIESAGNPSAQARTSSAAGLGQFIKATWLATVQKHKPGLLRGNARDAVAAMRVGSATAAFQLEMLARFTEDNAASLGIGWSDGDLYLAHFLGIGDARKLFRAPPSDLASSHVTAGAVAANTSILSGKSCAQVRAWAQASMENRWAKAGKTDWVKKFAGAQGAVPPPPDIQPAPAPKPKPKVPAETGTSGAVVVAGGTAAQQASQSGAGIGTIIVIVAITAALAVAGYFIVRWFKRRKES